jgi:hypothetical protein
VSELTTYMARQFGFSVSEDGTLVPEPIEQAAIVRMRYLKAEGLSLRAIAAAITGEGLPITHAAVKKVLDRADEPIRPR